MSDANRTFKELCLAGEATAAEIDDFVDRWHDGAGKAGASLGDFLGFTSAEYALWVEKPNSLDSILFASRRTTNRDHQPAGK